MLTLFVIALATWRIASLLSNEYGPFDLFAKVRKLSGVRLDELSHPYGTNVISRAISCVWCISFWVALMLTGLWLINERLALVVSLPFALSAMAIIIERIVKE